MSIPRISVVIPSYNHERFVNIAIESVQLQTFQDFEIVVTDDASQDRTADVVEAIKDPRISLRRSSSNRGACAAVNESIRRSRGEYICILNSDDAFLPGKLEKQVAYLDSHPDIAAVFAYPMFIDENGSPLAPGKTPHGGTFFKENRDQSEWLRHFFFYGNCLCHPSIMIRKSCYDKLGLYDQRLAQLPDFDMWVRLVSQYPIYIMSEPLMLFRVFKDSSNASAIRPDSLIRIYWEWERILRHYLDLSENLFNKTFAPEISSLGIDPKTDRRLILGKICLSTSQGHLNRFGLNILFDALPLDTNADAVLQCFNHTDLIRETGSRDVYNTLAPYRIAELEKKLKLSTSFDVRESQVVAPSWGGVSSDKPKLNLGCGPNILPGWVNMDIEPRPGAYYWDANQGIPAESNTISMIFNEHFIEHLDLQSAQKLLRECYRVLCPGGILRISTPSLQYMMEQYRLRGMTEWADVGWIPRTPCDLINEGLRWWGHQYCFDNEKLEECLVGAGFSTFAQVPYRKSAVPDLANRETRPYHCELIYEAQKPFLV